MINTLKNGVLIAVALLLAASGCGDARLAKVTGKLTYKGQPVPSTYVTFSPDDGSRPSRGLTDDYGQFALRFTHRDQGAILGHHKVYLTYNPSGEEDAGKVAPKADRNLQKIIARYSNPSKTELQFDVTTNGQFIEIKLD
jgi:hypothetical protein